MSNSKKSHNGDLAFSVSGRTIGISLWLFRSKAGDHHVQDYDLRGGLEMNFQTLF